MKEHFYYQSSGIGQIHGCTWTPDTAVRGVVQIVHGIAEHIERYDDFARYLNGLGYVVVAEDHMGHGRSIGKEGIQGYFHGGWFAAVKDSYHLMVATKRKYPGVPYVLLGHSMGSFMVRTMLCRYADESPDGAIICGTGWQPGVVLGAGKLIGNVICAGKGEKEPNEFMQNVAFGGYNRRVEHPRTPFDWLSRDNRVVDAYMADPLCGFVATAGLLRDMARGITYNQCDKNLRKMKKEMPVLFIAGGDDPVGSYGAGVERSAAAFREAGMEQVDCKLYPLMRHEILNEINRQEVYEDVKHWLDYVTKNQRGNQSV